MSPNPTTPAPPTLYRIHLISLTNLPPPTAQSSYQLAIGAKTHDLFITTHYTPELNENGSGQQYDITFNLNTDIILELHHDGEEQYMYFSIYKNSNRENRVKLQVNKYVNATKMRNIEFVLLIRGYHAKLKLRMKREDGVIGANVANVVKSESSSMSGSASRKRQREYAADERKRQQQQIGSSSPLELEKFSAASQQSAPSQYMSTGELYNGNNWQNDTNLAGLSTIKALPPQAHSHTEDSDVDSLLKHASHMLDLGTDYFSTPLQFSPTSSPSTSPRRQQNRPSSRPASPRSESPTDRKALVACIKKQRALMKQMEMDHVKIVQQKDSQLAQMEQDLQQEKAAKRIASPKKRPTSPNSTSSARQSPRRNMAPASPRRSGSTSKASPAASPRRSNSRSTPATNFSSMAEYQALIDMCNQLEKEKQQCARQLSKVRSQCHQYQAQIKEQQEQEHAFTEMNEKLRQKVQQLQKENKQLHLDQERDEEKMAEFQQQITLISDQYEQMQESFARERKAFRKNEEQLMAEREVLQNQLDRLIERLSQLQQQKGADGAGVPSEQLALLKQELEEAHKKNHQLRSMLDHALQTQKDGSTSPALDVSDALENPPSDEDTTGEDATDRTLRQKLKLQQHKIAKLLSERKMIEKTARALQLEKEMILKEHKTRVNALEKANAELQTRLQKEDHDADGDVDRTSLHTRIAQLEEENQQLRDQLPENLSANTLERHLQNVSTEKKVIDEEIRLLTQISSNDEAIQTLQNKILRVVNDLMERLEELDDNTSATDSNYSVTDLISHLLNLTEKQRQIYDESVQELKRRLGKVLEKSRKEHDDLELSLNNMEKALLDREEEISNINSRNAKYSEKINALNESIEVQQELSEKNSALSKRVYDLEQDIARLNTQLERKQKQVESLEEDRAQAQQRAEQVSKKESEWSNSKAYAYQELHETQNKLRQAERETQYVKEKNSSLMRQCKELTVSNVTLSDQLEQIQKEHEQCDATILELQHRVEDFVSENDRLKHNLEARDLELEDLVEVVENIKARMKICEESNEELHAEVKQLRDENQHLTEALEEQRNTHIDSAPTEEDDEHAINNERLLDTIEALTLDKQLLQDEIHRIEKEHQQALKKKHESITKERDELKREVLGLNFQLDKLNHQLATEKHEHERRMQEQIEKKVSEYQDRISKYKDLLADMEAKLRDTAATLTPTDDQIALSEYDRMKASYEEEIAMLQDQLADLEQNHHDELALVRGDLQKQIDELRKRHSANIKEQHDAGAHLHEMDSLKQEIREKNAQIDALEGQIADMAQDQQQESSSDSDALRASIDTVRRERDQLKREKMQMQSLIEESTHTIESLQARNVSLKQRIAELEENAYKLRQDIKRLTEENEVILAHNRSVHSETSTHSENNTSVSDKVEELNMMLVQKNDLIQKFEKKFRLLKTENEELINELAKLDEQVATRDTTAHHDELAEELEEQKQLLEQCQRELNTCTLSNSRLIADKDALQSEVNILQDKLEALTKELAQRDTDIESLLNKISEYEHLLEEKEQTLTAARSHDTAIARIQHEHAVQMGEMEDFCADLKRELTNLHHTNVSVKGELKQLREQLQERDALIVELEEAKSRALASVTNTSQEFRINLLQQNISERESVIKTLQVKLENLKREVSEKDAKIESLQSSEVAVTRPTVVKKSEPDTKVVDSNFGDFLAPDLTTDAASDESDQSEGDPNVKAALFNRLLSFGSDFGEMLQPPLVKMPTVPQREPSGDEQTSERLSRILHEFISTEQTYIYYLDVLDAYFIQPLKKGDLISEDNLKTLFLHHDSVSTVNKMFLEKISQHLVNEGTEKLPSFTVKSFENFTTCILGFSQSFKLYTAYIQHYPTTIALMSQLRKSNPQFDAFLGKQSERLKREKSRITSIQSLMITPVQRIPRYRLLLADLKKHTKAEHLLKPLEKAHDSIESIARFCENKAHEKENSARFVELCQQLDMQRLIEPGRKLVAEYAGGEYLVKNAWKEVDSVIVFNDMILLKMGGMHKRRKPEVVVVDLTLCGTAVTLEECEVKLVPKADAQDGAVHVLKMKSMEQRGQLVQQVEDLLERLQTSTRAQ